eukprot:CAMPEP_0172497740 /NCGR_PEP_ID=MMETSP1066-20121228/104420_1 /TAXON_ID=671091 /ORGANISM="Coscinodiscus wailesii, Strain CCMP2513" /LENGTH=147 /DNA_ID=CAMNT_0013270679 /DNA_START=121 /DNA_END=561 /DNA_ORIENTATION=-
MASPALEAQAKALNARMEGKAKEQIDEIDRTLLRPIARNSYACVLKCYDKVGTTGPTEQLQHCSQECQAPYQQYQVVVQQEVNQFQNRLNRAMMQCQDDARDLVTKDIQDDPAQMKKFEKSLISCISKTVDHHITLLGPMKKRIEAH